MSAALATSPSSPASISARRTSAAGTPAARATASTITPSSAPWRSSPSEEAAQEPLLGSVARAEQVRELPPPRGLAARSGRGADPVEGRIDVEQLEGGPGGRRGGRSRSAAHPTPIGPLRQRPGEVGDGDRHLVGAEAPQAGREPLDLRGPAGGPGEIGGRARNVVEQHARRMSNGGRYAFADRHPRA